jgi:hypothetical protein
MARSPYKPSLPAPTHRAEIVRLQAVIANMMGGPVHYASNGMLSALPDPYSDAALLSAARLRPFSFYCWLHGYKNTHDGITCNVMHANPEYASYQNNASSPDGTGGNPSIGAPFPVLKHFNLYITFVHLVPPSPHFLLTLPPPTPQQSGYQR